MKDFTASNGVRVRRINDWTVDVEATFERAFREVRGGVAMSSEFERLMESIQDEVWNLRSRPYDSLGNQIADSLENVLKAAGNPVDTGDDWIDG